MVGLLASLISQNYLWNSPLPFPLNPKKTKIQCKKRYLGSWPACLRATFRREPFQHPKKVRFRQNYNKISWSKSRLPLNKKFHQFHPTQRSQKTARRIDFASTSLSAQIWGLGYVLIDMLDFQKSQMIWFFICAYTSIIQKKWIINHPISNFYATLASSPLSISMIQPLLLTILLVFFFSIFRFAVPQIHRRFHQVSHVCI